MKRARILFLAVTLFVSVMTGLVAGCVNESPKQGKKINTQKRQKKSVITALKQHFNYAGYDWKASAKSQELDPDDINKLAKQKILITNRAYKQVYQPYVGSKTPVFITSDSLLNGFNVLYSESIKRWEISNSYVLIDFLKYLWKNLKSVRKEIKTKDKHLANNSFQRAQVTIAVALKLVDNSFNPGDERVTRLVDKEIKRIYGEKAVMKPKWLGPPDEGFTAIDYSKFKPRGFYSESVRLKNYFRAVRWLQSIPFRINKKEELLAILILARAMNKYRFSTDISYEKKTRFKMFFDQYSEFVGSGDNWDIMHASNEAQNRSSLNLKENPLEEYKDRFQEKATEYGKGPAVNDQIRFILPDSKGRMEVNFRMISPHRLPDAVMFQRTSDISRYKQRFPAPLEVCIALGSNFAKGLLKDGEKKKVLEDIAKCRTFFSAKGLYNEYLHCLEALLDAPEPDAPEFVKSTAWKLKSINTVLAGWMQIRHTWALQAKQSMLIGCLMDMPPGFVEPEPEFFARMARLVRKTRIKLLKSGAFKSNPRWIAARLKKMAAKLKASGLKTFDEKTLGRILTSDEQCMMMYMNSSLRSLGEDSNKIKKVTKRIRQLAEKIEKGKKIEDDMINYGLKVNMAMPLEPLWEKLELICLKLESISHKQLRGVPLSEEENKFIKFYGDNLGNIMLYGENSYVIPRDDAPQVVDIFQSPITKGKKKYLSVGISRARAIYILYPFKGVEIFCQGAVMPFYTFKSTSPMTDEEWKQRLDSINRPNIPSWMSPIVGKQGVKKPVLKKEK